MPRKNAVGASTWVDPDDAPELTDKFFEEADIHSNGVLVRRGRGRPRTPAPKRLVSLRLDADVIERFRATGEGWQTKMNQALREWLDSTRPGPG